MRAGWDSAAIQGRGRCPSLGHGTVHFDRATTRGYVDQVDAEHDVYGRAKKKAKGRWVWEPKSEGRANHQGDVLVYIYAISDQRNCRGLPPREVVEARLSQMKAKAAAPVGGSAGGIRTPDGRPFFATQRK